MHALTLNRTNLVFGYLMHTLRIECLFGINAQSNLDSPARQNKELNEKTAAIHRLDLILLRT